MEIENDFVVEAPIVPTWEYLSDIPSVMACLPGAEVTTEDEGVHAGSIKLRVGPVTAEYRGHAHVIEASESKRRIVLAAEGSDTRGNSNATAKVAITLTDLGDKTNVELVTDLSVTGVAQFSRGLMREVSAKLVAQFAACLDVKLEGTRAVDAIAAASAEAGSLEVAEEPLDLLTVAGSAVAKRVIPIAALAFIALIAVLVLVL
jgi:carbon monoxide dehydrogenase subunit G